MGFPSKNDLAQIFHHVNLRRRLSMSYSTAVELATLELNNDLDREVVTRTVLPYTVFQAPWLQLLAGRWHRPEQINPGELRTLGLWHKIVG